MSSDPPLSELLYDEELFSNLFISLYFGDPNGPPNRELCEKLSEIYGVESQDPYYLARHRCDQLIRGRVAGSPTKARYEALRRANGKCQLCGASAKYGAQLEVDHIKPVSKRPDLKNDPGNMQVLCKTCNIGKLDLDESDWR